jgi:hypothetical protein
MASYCVKYESDINDDRYVFKVDERGKTKGRGVRMVKDEYGARFEFFEFSERQLENIEEGLESGNMVKIPESEYLERLKKFLKWCVKSISDIEKIEELQWKNN